MFDLFATGNQVMLLVMALAFMGLGGLLLGFEIRARVWGIRVTGTVVGVRETKPNMYYSVYSYTLPTGESIEATSSTGSNSKRGRETGRRVELFTFADRPDDVSEAGVPIAGLFGGLFFAVGLWPLHTALTSRPVTPLTWLGLAGVAAYIAYRIHGLVIPKAQRKSLGQWRQLRKDEIAAVPVTRVEDLPSSPAGLAARAGDQKKSRWLIPILLLAGVAALGFGVHLGQQTAHRQSAGLHAQGTVVAMAESSDSDGSTYHPVVRFQRADGSTFEFHDSVGTNPPSHHVGETVPVLYTQDSSSVSPIIDRGVWNWLPSVLLALFGAVMVFGGLRMITAR